MKFEGYVAKTEAEPALDGDLFAKLQECTVASLSGVLLDEETLVKEKESFLNDGMPCPRLRYESIKTRDYVAKEKALLALKEEIHTNLSINPAIARSYVWEINVRLAKLRMLRELQKTMLGENEKYHMRRLSRYSDFVYGKPEPEIYRGVTEELYRKLESVKSILPIEKKDAYERLLSLANKPESYLSSNEESSDTKAASENIESADAIRLYFEETIKEMGLDGEWSVHVSKKGKTNFSVASENKKVYIPAEEKLKFRPNPVTQKSIRGLIVHELGTHALRSHNGSRSRLRLLSTGMDRSVIGEEGLATYRAQQEMGDTKEYAGFDNYFVASLAKGLDGGGERDFAQTFTILCDYYSVCHRADEVKSKEMAWARCMRIFRGTTGTVPGVIFTKDIVYRKGNIATYTLMKKDGAEKIDFNLGKFDPTNTRHLAVLIELGILDKDLESLIRDEGL